MQSTGRSISLPATADRLSRARTIRARALAKVGRLALQGKRGHEGARGEKGDRGPPAPSIVSWIVDKASYSVTPVLSDGTKGPVLELRPLFVQFNAETAP